MDTIDARDDRSLRPARSKPVGAATRRPWSNRDDVTRAGTHHRDTSARWLHACLWLCLAAADAAPLDPRTHAVAGARAVATTFSINAGIAGAWYNPATSGQGVLFDIEPQSRLLFGAVFTYDPAAPAAPDSTGHLWLTLQGAYQGNQAQVPIYLTRGGAFDRPDPTSTQAVGRATVEFDSCTSGRLDYELDSPRVSGSIPLARVIPASAQLCRQLQPDPGALPDQLGAEQKVAFVDVSVVPMTGPDFSQVLARQVVLVEDGVITRMGRVGEVVIPTDAVQIDARGLTLGPGLAEMHLHISTGGAQAAEDAGLLLIANGVTQVLNMGDLFTVDVPGLGKRFESGAALGPSLLAGNIAYGQAGNGARSVTTPEAATSYAELLANRDYRYIKEYWFLQPPVLERLEFESGRLGLPIIGHIPLSRPMETSLSRGQRMAAHIQEPYVTYMGNQTDPSLIAPAAQILLRNGTYLTPTLAVFESYRRVYGGDEIQFAQLSQRDGQQYTAASIKQEWLGFLQSGTVRGPGQRPGGYDRIYAFFEQMTLAFHEAGVPMLIGTDAPGFPGVMSGFGVHVEMDLLRKVGLPNVAIYRAATHTAGRFVDDTLDPDVGFGSVAEGKRADLLLLSGNPLESLETLRQPLAVMARGRLWSRANLQSRLDALSQELAKRAALPPDAEQDEPHAEARLCVEHFGVGDQP